MTCSLCSVSSRKCHWCRYPRTSAVRCRAPTGRRPSITACRERLIRSRTSRESTWCLSDGSRLKSDSTVQSRSRGARAESSRSPQKSMTRIGATISKSIEPLLQASRSFVEFVGEVGGSAKDELLGGACALLFPIDWPEPFGLVMIEALACGTPVIAWRNGSVPEILENGKTGFVVETVAEAVEAVRKIESLDRLVC